MMEFLPADMRGDVVEITTIAAGLSGAGVYMVRTSGASLVLKVASSQDPPDVRRRRFRVAQMAGELGAGPRVVHVDHERGAILMAFIQDRSFAAFCGNPATRDAALHQLASTLRTVHSMDREGSSFADPRGYLVGVRSGLHTRDASPSRAIEIIDRAISLAAPRNAYEPVLCHNDVNPSNLVYDGERVLLLDWDTTGIGDPYYDLAAPSIFFRMDDATCMRLLSLYEGKAVEAVPARFRYNQCIVAALCGATFISLSGAASSVVDASPVLPLGDVYILMRSGELDVRTADGQLKFGLALLRESDRYYSMQLHEQAR